jgi:hypothetical protein
LIYFMKSIVPDYDSLLLASDLFDSNYGLYSELRRI